MAGEAIPQPVVQVNSSVGGTLMGALVQGLSWLAFGFAACGGWKMMEWVLRKI